MSDRPGVMLYFDSVQPALRRLDDSQCGALFRAIMDYAEHGAVPELDLMSGMVFDLLRPALDRDAVRYEETREQRQYAAYSRESKRRGEQPMDVAEWRLSRCTESTGRYGPSQSFTEHAAPSPSTSPSITPASSSSPAPAPISSSSSLGEGVRKGEAGGCRGDGEGEALRVYRDWLEADNRRDGIRSAVLRDSLNRLGYDVSPSRKLRRIASQGP